MRDFSTLPALCRLFDGVAGAEMGGLLACLGARVVALGRGQALFRPGARADRFGVVLSGGLVVTTCDGDGRQTIIRRVGPFETVAAAPALAGRRTLGVGVEAAPEAEVLLLRADRVAAPCSSACAFHLRLVRNLTAILAGRTLELNRKIGILSRRATADRLLAYLRGVAADCGAREFDIPFDRQALADFLCVERSALSAEIGRLARAGVLAARKRHFALLGGAAPAA